MSPKTFQNDPISPPKIHQTQQTHQNGVISAQNDNNTPNLALTRSHSVSFHHHNGNSQDTTTLATHPNTGSGEKNGELMLDSTKIANILFDDNQQTKK
jgi:hypothetical protein